MIKNAQPVQSIERTFRLLEALADAGGSASLNDLARVTGLPIATAHRLLRTLVGIDYVRQEPTRRYALDTRLARLGDAAKHRVDQQTRPLLWQLAQTIGETANLATLDGDSVVYVAQASSRPAMWLFTDVGNRILPHTTALGKAILAQRGEAEVRALVDRTGLPLRTSHTITSLPAFLAELRRIRDHGYALDDEEQEVGTRCIAVPLLDGTARAISISGPETRMTDELIALAVPSLQFAARSIEARASITHETA